MGKIITIDGPVSSGKNSVGHLLAKKLGFQFINTGSIYRIFALYTLQKKYSTSDLEKINIEFKDEDGKTLIYADGVEISSRLHEPSITEMTPKVAAKPEVRQIAKVFQRRIGQMQNTVMDGRDIGSEIFPDSTLKIYLTATPEVRAKRRHKQLKVINPTITLGEVLSQIQERDKMDTERKASPMRVPEGAIIIDNSDLTVEETVEKILESYRHSGANEVSDRI